MPWAGQHLQLAGAAACCEACTHQCPPGSMRLLSRRSMQWATSACSWLVLMPSCAQMRASLPMGEGSITSTSSLSFPLLPAGVAAPSGLGSMSCLSPSRPLRMRTVRSLSTCRCTHAKYAASYDARECHHQAVLAYCAQLVCKHAAAPSVAVTSTDFSSTYCIETTKASMVGWSGKRCCW